MYASSRSFEAIELEMHQDFTCSSHSQKVTKLSHDTKAMSYETEAKVIEFNFFAFCK